MSDNNEKILTKIRNLLSLAESGNNDEESQTALLMAQKLMLKHKIEAQEIHPHQEQEIIIKSLSVYKRLYWWEKVLAKIISDNFRTMFYIQSNRLPNQSSVQRKIVFMGFPEDVDLSYQMFYLVADAMKYYSKLHFDHSEVGDLGNRERTNMRKAYYEGFLDGLAAKFERQKVNMVAEDQKYALVIKTPQAVMDRFHEEITGRISFNQVLSSKDSNAYRSGFQKGSSVQLNQNQLDQPK